MATKARLEQFFRHCIVTGRSLDSGKRTMTDVDRALVSIVGAAKAGLFDVAGRASVDSIDISAPRKKRN